MSDTYKDCLRQHGMKSTKARNLVLDVLSCKQTLVTVEAVYAELLEGGNKVSFSTVYRILEMFTQRDLTEKIFLPDEGKYGFSLRRPGHTHRLICLQCHQIVDLPHCPLHDYEREVEKRLISISSAIISNSTGTALPAKKSSRRPNGRSFFAVSADKLDEIVFSRRRSRLRPVAVSDDTVADAD